MRYGNFYLFIWWFRCGAVERPGDYISGCSLRVHTGMAGTVAPWNLPRQVCLSFTLIDSISVLISYCSYVFWATCTWHWQWLSFSCLSLFTGLGFQGQPFSPCSMWWMQRLEFSWSCHCVTMWNQHWSSYIGCWLSKELHTSCVCSSTTSTSDKHHNTCQTVYLQFLQPVADTNWDRLAQWFTFCEEQELDLENVVSSTLVQPPGTLFLPTFMTLLTPVHSENDSECTFWSCLPLTTVGAPGHVV